MGPAILLLIAPMAQSLAQFAMSMYPPLPYTMSKRAWQSMPVKIPEAGDLIDALRRGYINENEYYENMQALGFAKDVSKVLFEKSTSLLSAGDYVALYRRGEMDRATLDSRLHESGFSQREIPGILKATEFYPGPQDLIRFAVREAYSSDKISKFGLMENIPQKFLDEAEKVGLSQESAKLYWASHWNLPSVNQGYEMYHRRVIDEDTLYQLMEALDISPFWRDKLKEVSYNPLTRVDVRRMYGYGILDEDGVYNSYLDGGYSPENARRMTEFTLAYEDDEQSGLTRATVTSAYKKDIIKKEEFIEYLRNLNYAESVINFYVSIADSEKMDNYLDDYVDELKNRYFQGSIDISGIRKELDGFNLSSNYVDSILSKIEMAQSKKRKLPTKADLTDWMSKNLINEREYSARMKQIGYSEDDIVLYLSEFRIDQEQDEKRYLSDSKYVQWFVAGIITEKKLKSLLTQKKLSNFDIDKLIESARGKINESKRKS